MRRFAALMLFAASAHAGIAYRFEGVGSGRVVAEGPKMRVEYTSGSRVVSVWISTDGGKTVTVLDPAKKTYSKLDVDAMLGDVSVSGSHATVRDLGDGGVIEGFPTHKWAVDSQEDIAVAGIAVHTTMHSESWRTDRIPEDAQLRGTKLEKVLSANVKGFPLKEVTTVRTKPANGRETSTTVTAEVHDVRRVTTTPEQFAIPPGYRKK